MNGAVRNRLAELLLEGFDDPGKRLAVRWLKLYCDMTGRAKRSDLPLEDLLREGRATLSNQDGRSEDALSSLIGTEGLLRLHRADTGEAWPKGLPVRTGDIPWLIGLGKEARSDSVEVSEKVRSYAIILTSSDDFGSVSSRSDPLRRALGQAAACFNAGLFFEAHEHLERFWRSQPEGQMKRFLQGIIQISVGFHHAHRGSYDGAVNQLAKGLEKTAGLTGEVLGLDCDAFLPAVAKARATMLARDRRAMGPMPLVEVPRMPVSGAKPSPRERGQANEQSKE